MKLRPEALCAFLMLLATCTCAWALDVGSTMISNMSAPASPLTVRVNNLACVEALLNIGANGIEIIGIVVTVMMLVVVTTKKSLAVVRWKAVTLAMLPAAVGLCTPGVINLMVVIAREGNLFS